MFSTRFGWNIFILAFGLTELHATTIIVYRDGKCQPQQYPCTSMNWPKHNITIVCTANSFRFFQPPFEPSHSISISRFVYPLCLHYSLIHLLSMPPPEGIKLLKKLHSPTEMTNANSKSTIKHSNHHFHDNPNG